MISLISIFKALILGDTLFIFCCCHITQSPCFHLQNINDIRNGQRTKVPMFDLETGARSGFKELEVSEDCGVVSNQTYLHCSQNFACSLCIYPSVPALLLKKSTKWNLFCLLCQQIIFEGVYALHPDIRKSLDLWVAVVSIPLLPILWDFKQYHVFMRKTGNEVSVLLLLAIRLEVFIRISFLEFKGIKVKWDVLCPRMTS